MFELTMQRVFTCIATFFICCISLPSSAQVLSDISFDTYRDATIPFDSKLATHFFGPSVAPSGETAIFTVQGPLIVHLYRQPYQIQHGGRVRLTARRKDGTLLREWFTTIHSFQGIGYLKKLELVEAQPVWLEFQVIDDAEGGPTRSAPYTLIMEAWAVSKDGFIKPHEKQAPFDPTILSMAKKCVLKQNLGTKGEFIEAAATVKRGNVAQGMLLVKTFVSGPIIGIKVPAEWTTDSVPVVLTISRKIVGDSPFEPVCVNFQVGTKDAGQLLVVTAPQSEKSLWRIELAAPGRTPLSSITSELQVFRTKPLSHIGLPLDSDNDLWRNSSSFFCIDKPIKGSTEVTPSSEFGGRSVLKIKLPPFPNETGKAQREALIKLLLRAVSLWVRSCTVCRLDNLAIVKIDERTFVHPGLSHLMESRSISKTQQTISISPQGLEQKLKWALAYATVGSMQLANLQQPLPYEEITGRVEETFKEICTTKMDITNTPILKNVQKAACGIEINGIGFASNIIVRFRMGDTACGDELNIIACRADYMLTEFNVRDYKFIIEDSSPIYIGNGTIEIDMLHAVLHEMGHWIGLAHVDEGESIMASSLEQSRCIDRITVQKLSSFVQGKEQYEQNQPMAFSYHK